ncbi:MAG: cation transporter [Bacteroidetes bacterium]|nr:cation transporter [Bacteroidota bacterium]
MSEFLFCVPRISCEGCVRAIKGILTTLEETEMVEVDMQAKTVLVRTRSTDDSALREALARIGYPADPALVK